MKYTFKVVLDSLLLCEQKLTKYAEEGTVFELNDVMIKLTFDVITESAFGINWKTQEDGVTSEGNVFLHESDIRTREGFRRTLNPFRKYCFWLSSHSRYEVATKRVLSILRRVVEDYRSRANAVSTNSDDESIMGHLMRNEYSCDDRRIVDMNSFLLAGK